MGRGRFPVPEQARTLHHTLCAVIFPGDVGRVSFPIDPDFPPIDDQGLVGAGYVRIEGALGGIVFEQMGQGFGVCQIIDGHKFNIVAGKTRPERHPSDTSKSIDSNF